MAHLKVHVSYDDFDVSSSIVVPLGSIYERYFEQHKTTDIPELAAALGEATPIETMVTFIQRADAATDLSTHIAEALLEIMQENDTYNGYPIKKRG